jgi:hypothetical protein
MAAGDGRLRDLAAPGRIFYVSKTALDSIRRKRDQNENVQPSSVKELVAIGLLEDSDVLVPVDMSAIDCDFRDLESMIADRGPTDTADLFLAARMFFELDSVDGRLDELPRELTVGELKRLWTACSLPSSTATSSRAATSASLPSSTATSSRAATGASLVRSLPSSSRDASSGPQHLAAPSEMRALLRFFYNRLMEAGASHGTARGLILINIKAFLEQFSAEDFRARCAQAPSTAVDVVGWEP